MDQVLQLVLRYPNINAQKVVNPSVRIEMSRSDDDVDRGEYSIIYSDPAAAPEINVSSGNVNIDSGGVSESDMATGENNLTSQIHDNVNQVDQSESDADENYFSEGYSEEGIDRVRVDSAGEIAALYHSATCNNNELEGTLSDEQLINDSHDASLSVVGSSGIGESGNGNNIGSSPTDDVDDDEVEIIKVIDKSNLLGRTVVRDTMSSANAQPVHFQIPLVTIDGGMRGDFTALPETTGTEPEISDLNTIFESESFTLGKFSMGSETSTRPPTKRKSSGSTSDKAKKKRIRGIRQAPVKEVQPGTRSSFLDNVLSQQSSRGNSSNPSTSSQGSIPPPHTNSPVNEGGLLTLAKIKREAHALQHFDRVTNMWVCLCGHLTQTKIGLGTHVREHGTEVPRYKCPECLQRFKFVYILKMHLITDHGYGDLPRHLPSCKICFKVVPAREQLINHRNESGKLCMPRRLRKANEAGASTDTISGGGAVIPEPRQKPKVPSIIIRLPRPVADDDNCQ